MKCLVISVLVWLCAVGSVWAGAATPAQQDLLAAGRRMAPLPVMGQTLKGRAPQGQGEPFRILSGSEVLWEGKAGESFEVPMGRNVGEVYLYTANSRNLNWQELTWSGGRKDALLQAGKDTRRKYDAAKEGVLPGSKDAGPALRKLLSKVRSERGSKGSSIVFPKGEYHFYPEGALEMSFYVSNHDQQDVTPVGIPLVDQQKLKLVGNGSTFIFHGKMQPFLLMDCADVTISDVSIDYAAPFYVEGKIEAVKDGKTTMSFAPLFQWKVQNGRFRILREGGEAGVNAALPFEKEGPMVPRNGGGDIGWTDQAEQVGANKVRFNADAERMGLKPGQILVLRNGARPHPAMVLYRAKSTRLNNVIFRDSQGMALLAQRSEDITIKGGGCVTSRGRVHTVSADATHFSNCRGKVLTENALYEGMMDDAINVHSTSLGIESVESPTVFTVKYMHGQSVGFEVFRPGEKVQFIKGKTLENHPALGNVKEVVKLDETHLRITLAEPMPEDIGQGDAVENADWYPAVTFKNNTVRYNRARGCLFTTPKPVLVEGNKFIRSHGSAILLAGDAQGWYESGACRDVTIRGNLFDHNLTASYQFTEAVIAIIPEVRQLDRQQEPYHRHIVIEGNTFRTHRVPLLFVRSGDEITWRNNKVSYDDKFPARRNGEPFIFNGPKPQKSYISTTP